MTDLDQRGTSKRYLLSRLRAERPDLAKQVATGELSVYRAGCQAGMCTPRFSLHGHDPDVLAKAMRRNLPADVLQAVVARLAAQNDTVLHAPGMSALTDEEWADVEQNREMQQSMNPDGEL